MITVEIPVGVSRSTSPRRSVLCESLLPSKSEDKDAELNGHRLQ